MSRVFIFDAYGTLFDVHAAISRHRAEAGSEADHFSEIWRAKQLEYTWTLTLADRYADFWTLTERALDFAFARIPQVDRSIKPKLLDAYSKLDAYPDAHPLLRDLKSRGHVTGILSNGSPHMLASAVQSADMGRLLDAVLSVDAIRMYKPRREVYALATKHFKVSPGEIVFVSSNRWDIMGAAACGFCTAWVNRTNAPQEYEPAADAVVSDLKSLTTIDFAR